MVEYFLILTLWVSGYGQSWSPAMTATLIPTPYASKEECNAAGDAASKSFNGGAKIEWVCVPTTPDTAS